jgi:hypothetical protein
MGKYQSPNSDVNFGPPPFYRINVSFRVSGWPDIGQ